VPVRGDKAPERIEFAGPYAFRPTISNDRLAYAVAKEDSDVWRFQADGSSPLIRSTFAEYRPEFSPDGLKVAFTSNRNGETTEIWVANADGTNQTQLTHGPGQNQGSARWSPDGRWLAFDSQDAERGFDIFTIESTGGQPRRFTSEPSNEYAPSWSRDGKWIYFPSDRTGRVEVWRCPFPAGTSEQWQQMTTSGGDSPRESSDGATLYYTGPNGELLAKPLHGGQEQKLIDFVVSNFAVVEDGIFYGGRRGQDGGVPLLFYAFSSRSSRELTRITGSADNGLSVSPDRKSILYATSLDSGQDLMRIEPFR
jgi:Tol biopolymer transport system component